MGEGLKAIGNSFKTSQMRKIVVAKKVLPGIRPTLTGRQMRDVSITSTNQPTQEAIRELFGFSDEHDTKLWVESKRQEVFTVQEAKQDLPNS